MSTNRNVIYADWKHSHKPAQKARRKCINEVIDKYNFNRKCSHEMYLAKKISVVERGHPWIEYPVGWRNK